MKSAPQEFLLSQVAQIRKGGLGVVRNKLELLFLACMGFMVALAVRALRPIVTIRIGHLASNAIGVLPSETEVYLCERDAGIQGRGTLDIFYFDTRGMCNYQLERMLERTLRISRFAAVLHRVHGRLPQEHRIEWAPNIVDTHGLLIQTKPHLSFTDEEEERGRAAMLELGIQEGAAFVCFHARDQAFTAGTQPEWNRHESDFRNCSVETFLPAAQELAGRGYFALRMGYPVQGPLPPSDPKVIDYATNGRTDFLDVYLSAKCRFFLGCNSGLFAVPMVFRRPLVLTNFSVLEVNLPYYGPNILVIPKILRYTKDGHILSIREILDSGVGRFYHTEQYEQAGIEVVDNTAGEISDATIEMEKRLDGTWHAAEEDEELQQKFWSPFKERFPNQVFGSRIGAQFLRQNMELIAG